DESEEREFDQMLRVFDKKAVDRRIEEECRRSPARNCRYERRHHSPVRRCDDDRDQIDENQVPWEKNWSNIRSAIVVIPTSSRDFNTDSASSCIRRETEARLT